MLWKRRWCAFKRPLWGSLVADSDEKLLEDEEIVEISELETEGQPRLEKTVEGLEGG